MEDYKLLKDLEIGIDEKEAMLAAIDNKLEALGQPVSKQQWQDRVVYDKQALQLENDLANYKTDARHLKRIQKGEISYD